MSKLALGSVNFGMNYGLTNYAGKISQLEIAKILSEAEEAGIKVIDTAQAYGDSEARIGALSSQNRFEIVTKIDINLEKDWVSNSVTWLVKRSCNRLNQLPLYAVLLHRPEVLLSDQGRMIINELLALKEQNIISKVGVSIYSPEILGEISKRMHLDIVQAPFNIFDQQIMSSGWSDKLKSNNTEIYTRSVFLQGLLLMQKSRLPKYFQHNWPDLFNSWYKFLATNEVDAVDIALDFVLKQNWIDKVVVGVDSLSQLRSLLEVEKSSIAMDPPKLECSDRNLINPSNWKLV